MFHLFIGEKMKHLFPLAEFERELIRERTNAGLQAARARGRLGGRPKKLNKKRQQKIKKLYESKVLTIQEICETEGISKPTLYRYVRE